MIESENDYRLRRLARAEAAYAEIKQNGDAPLSPETVLLVQRLLADRIQELSINHETHEDEHGPVCCSEHGVHAPALHRNCILR